MSVAYRCMKCRGRNTLPRPLEHYIRTPKCKHCGWFRFYLDKARQYRKDYCSCEGYHYTHRIKSKFCVHHPEYEFNVRTMRYGEDPEDVRIEMALNRPANKEEETTECPF